VRCALLAPGALVFFDFRLVELAWDNANNHTGRSDHGTQGLRWRSTSNEQASRDATSKAPSLLNSVNQDGWPASSPIAPPPPPWLAAAALMPQPPPPPSSGFERCKPGLGTALGSGKSQPLLALCFSLALSTKPTLTPVVLKKSPDPISTAYGPREECGVKGHRGNCHQCIVCGKGSGVGCVRSRRCAG